MNELERVLGAEKAVIVKPSLEVQKVVPWETAFTLVMFKNGFPIMNREDRIVRSESLEFPMPLIVANYSHKEIAPKTRSFRSTDYASKYEIRRRDNFTCQYCGRYGDTIDHIVPRSKGGMSTWGNLCVACHDCNQIKGHKSLSEVGFKAPEISQTLPVRARGSHALQGILLKTLEGAVAV